MNQKQIKIGGFYRIKQDSGQREKVILCGEVIELDGNRQMNGRPAAAWVRVRLWKRNYGPEWRQQTIPTGGEVWVTPRALVGPWHFYALRVDQDEQRRAIDAELAKRQQDDLERRLDAVGIAVKSGLGSAPYLLSHETLCALLQQAEQAAELKAKLAETNAAFQERDLLRRMAVQESLETRGKLIESEKLLSQASAERIRVHGLLSALFRSPPNQNAGELPMWAVIKDLLHVGRTRAHELCLEFGRDPDEEVAGLVENGLCSVCDVIFCERCEELTHVPEGHSPECEHCKSQDTVGGEP